MFFSVITPCLNPGLRLQRCIESVARQDHPYCEHIVVDGGSTDGTIELLERTDGVKWISEPDRGQSHAINKGFELASGEILTWVNADDILLDGALRRVAGLFAADPSLGWVYSDLEEVRDGRRRVAAAPQRLEAGTFNHGNRFGPGTFFSASALNQVGGLDESFELTMDLDLWLRLMDNGIPSARVAEPLVSFEIHRESKTGSRGPEAFMLEEGRALAKSGRHRAGWMSVGRAAATVARRDGVPLDEAIARHVAQVDLKRTVWSPHAVRAGALTELSIRRRSIGGLRHLLDRDVWRFAESQHRALLCIRTTAARYIKGQRSA